MRIRFPACLHRYIKKNTQSLKNAVENDLFLTSQDTDMIFRISDIFNEAKR